MITDINMYRKKKEQTEGSGSKSDPADYQNTLLQLKVSLKGEKPPVWRRVLVAQNWNFTGLHQVIRTVFALPDSSDHLFRFDYNMIWIQPLQKFADDAMFEPPDGMPVPGEVNAENEVPLSDIFSDYKSGNYLPHGRLAGQVEIRLEAVVEAEQGLIYPRCTSLRGNLLTDGEADPAIADLDLLNQRLAVLLENRQAYTYFNPYDLSLATCLAKLSLADLRQIARMHKVSNASEKKKAALVKTLEKLIPERLITYMARTEEISIGQMLILLMLEADDTSPFDLEILFTEQPYDPRVDNQALFLAEVGFVFNLASLDPELLPEEMRDEPDAYLPLLLLPSDIRKKLRAAIADHLFDSLFETMNKVHSMDSRKTDPEKP